MSDYSFSTLAPNEFEDLSKDLLECHLNVPLQAFTTGRDGGIDLRHAPCGEEPWIIQCKHYAGSRFTNLKRSVQKEVHKLRQLKPQRYILATSCGLTPGNLDELYDLLAPYCVSKHDILGKSDLNALLRSNSDIERRHPKLWITSEAVLNRVLQNDVFVQSDMTRESILRRLSLYVYTHRFEDARRRLNSDRVCIISGVPGVGKTTLAEMLLVEHLMDGWELVTIHQNVSEGLRALQAHPEAKQVFYYDDFLGQVSSGEKLAKNEDGALLQLLRSVQHSASKRFVLTTREYILAQARREHEKLSRTNLDIYRFVVECKNYDEEAKARILANHLYFNEVPQGHIATLVKDEGYREIIEHDNYNPRLIESMTSQIEVGGLQPEEYLDAFMARLDDPSQLWEHIYSEQLSESSRHVLLALAAAGTPTPLAQLERDFECLYRKRCRDYGWTHRTDDFERSLNELEGNFVRISERNGSRVIEWHNPSVLDFLGSWLRRHRRDTEALLDSANRFEQIATITNTVSVLLQASDSLPECPPSDAVLADALSRNSDDWSWSQIGLALRLASGYTGGPVQQETSLILDKFIESQEIKIEDMSLVCGVFEQIQKCDWLAAERQAILCKQIKMSLLALEADGFEQLEHFLPLARWASRQRSCLTTDEFASIQNFSGVVVRGEINADYSPNMESIWVEMKDTVEELQELLGLDYSQDIESIEREIENADPPEDAKIANAPQFKSPVKSTVDAIFHALIEQ